MVWDVPNEGSAVATHVELARIEAARKLRRDLIEEGVIIPDVEATADGLTPFRNLDGLPVLTLDGHARRVVRDIRKAAA